MVCGVCGRASVARCARCAARYCGRACQARDWAAGHGGRCGPAPSVGVRGGGGAGAPLRLALATWNMSGARPDDWPDAAHVAWRSWARRVAGDEHAGARLVVFAAQEVAAPDAFGDALHAALGAAVAGQRARRWKRHTVALASWAGAAGYAFDQALHVFWDVSAFPQGRVAHEERECFGATPLPGVTPASCVKGALAARFVPGGGEAPGLLLAGAHFPFVDAGARGDAARAAAWRQTRALLDRMLAAAPDGADAPVFVAGDLNYRQRGPQDALTAARLDGTVFAPGDGWIEAGQPRRRAPDAAFRPPYPRTCKLAAGATAAARARGDAAAYDGKRTPSHCDRILYRVAARAPRPRERALYTWSAGSTPSDHDAVALEADVALAVGAAQ